MNVAFNPRIVRLSSSSQPLPPRVEATPDGVTTPSPSGSIPCPALLGVPDGERGIPSSEAIPAQKCSDTANVIAGQVRRTNAGIVTGNSERAVANSDEATSAPMGLPLWS